MTNDGEGDGIDETCYCEDVDGVKERLLIALSDSTYDDEIEDACNEACCYINMRLSLYEATLPVDDPNCILKVICLDLASGIFKRRHFPDSMDNGWWGQGERKLNEYIQSHYFKGKFVFVKACHDHPCYKTFTTTSTTTTTTVTTTTPP